MAFFDKFKNKLLGLIIFGTLVPVTIVATYSIVSSNRTLIKLVSQELTLQGNNSAKTFDFLLENIKADILYLSQTPPVQGIVRARDNQGIDPVDGSSYQDWTKRLNIIFSSFLEARNYYYQLRYLDENGNELVRVNNRNGKVEIVDQSNLQNKDSSQYFKDALLLKKGQVYISEINLNREKGQIEQPPTPVIRYATPIFNKAGENRGIIIANILVDPLFELAKNQELEKEALQEFFVVNKDGYYLSNPDETKEWGFELNKTEQTISEDYSSKIVSEILSLQNGLIEKNTKSLINYQTIYPDQQNKTNPFILIYQTPKASILAPINQVKFVAIFVTIILGGVFVFVGIYVLESVVKSMSQLTGFVSSFSSQVVSTVDQQERITTEQSSSVQETTATMEELNASSQQSAQQAESAALGARQALDSVAKGNEAVAETVKEMENLKAKVEEISNQIQNLNQTTTQISGISDLVSDLANQTNMLALNAAVEAVRAGEHGKGFGVVADEIRKLSDQSQQSGQKINALVEQIHNAIKSTVNVTKQGKESVESSVNIAYNTAAVFSEVASVMEQIVQSSHQIALNSRQQAAATQQVSETMNSLQKGALETAQGITTMKTGTEQLNQASKALQEVI